MLTKEDINHLIQLINAATFKGDAVERVMELKQKLIKLLMELDNEAQTKIKSLT